MDFKNFGTKMIGLNGETKCSMTNGCSCYHNIQDTRLQKVVKFHVLNISEDVGLQYSFDDILIIH